MDILEKLRLGTAATVVEGVALELPVVGPLDDLLEEAADEIELLRGRLAEIERRITSP